MKSKPDEPSVKEVNEQLRIAKIKAGMATGKLKKLREQIANAEQDLSDTKQLLNDEQSKKSKIVADFAQESNATEDGLRLAKADLKQVEASLKERQSYLKGQEKAVNIAVEDFNTRLRELQGDITTTDHLKDDAVRELADAQEQVRQETAKALEVANHTQALQALYTETAATYKIELRELLAAIQQAKLNHKKVLHDGQAIVKRLAEKERELDVRAQTLNEVAANQSEEATYLRKKRGRLNT